MASYISAVQLCSVVLVGILYGLRRARPLPRESTLSLKKGLILPTLSAKEGRRSLITGYYMYWQFVFYWITSQDSIGAFNNPKVCCYLFFYIANLGSTCDWAFVLWARDCEFVLSLDKSPLSSDNASGRPLRSPLYSNTFLKAIFAVRWTIKCQLWAWTCLVWYCRKEI